MTEREDHKFSLPIAGILALIAVVSGYIIYQPLKTSRPIDEEAEKKAASYLRVQSRLWQDPFEVVKTHRLNELERSKNDKSSNEKDSSHMLFGKLVQEIKDKGGSSKFRILAVFVDGNPYASGVQSRLKDRYAVVSALGAAGYMPESGEYMRYFSWPEGHLEELVPIERFRPKAKIRNSRPEDVLVLWLRDQDFSEKPLAYLNKLIEHLAKSVSHDPDTYTILGPRFSGTLSAMIQELRLYQQEWEEILRVRKSKSAEFTPLCLPPAEDIHKLQGTLPLTFRVKLDLSKLKGITIYSYGPTAEDTFLLDDPPGLSSVQSIEDLFQLAHISLERTIKTDVVLAEQLVKELQRREVDLSCINKVAACTPPRIALISEWDTLYGRALPRTFVAVAKNMAENMGEKDREKDWKIDKQKLKSDIDELRNDEWPSWVVRYSYLAGLDGELPPNKGDKDGSEDRAKDKTDDKEQRIQRGMEVAEGRDQLDYLQRLAAELKLKESGKRTDSENGKQADSKPGDEMAKFADLRAKFADLWEYNRKNEFKAIGVLGSDVYDKLLILQALRKKFPRAVFFTMDLDARLIHPAHWQWTRNLVVATHFGLQLHPKIQESIPPFRDNSQTSLFYATLRALRHLQPVPALGDQPNSYLRMSSAIAGEKLTLFASDIEPRLFEIGRNSAIDISHDKALSSGKHTSIHSERTDVGNSGKVRPLVGPDTILWFVALVVPLVLCARMISSEVVHALQFRRNNILSYSYVFLLVNLVIIFGLLEWARGKDGTGGEPFILTEGISVWPSVVIYLLATGLSIIFFIYSNRLLKKNDEELSEKFDVLSPESMTSSSDARKAFLLSKSRWNSIHNWHEKTECGNDVAKLWQEYRALGGLLPSLWRIVPQFLCFGVFVLVLFWKFGFPGIPCRGPECFYIYRLAAYLSWALMLLLTLYVIDTTRLCRKLIRILCEKKFPWSDRSQMRDKEAAKRRVDKACLNELLCIDLIAKRSAAVSKLLYFPIIILFLMSVPRYPYIDNFDLPTGLVIIYGIIGAYAVGTVVALRASAGRAKRKALQELQKKLDQLSGQFNDSLNRKENRRQINQVIQEIENNHEGAFLPFHKYPVLGAIAVPAGGASLLYLIEYLATTWS